MSSATGFEAFDADQRTLGMFPSQREAATEVMRRLTVSAQAEKPPSPSGDGNPPT